MTSVITKILIVRTFNHPVERIFQAWTNPGDLARWMWSPYDRNMEVEVDLRVGGRYPIYTQAPPDQRDFGDRWGMWGFYTEIVANKRLGRRSQYGRWLTAWVVTWVTTKVPGDFGFVRSRWTCECLAAHGDRMVLHCLPKYAPDLNPIERIWWHLHEQITRNHRCGTMEELLDPVFEWLEHRRPFEVQRDAYLRSNAA